MTEILRFAQNDTPWEISTNSRLHRYIALYFKAMIMMVLLGLVGIAAPIIGVIYLINGVRTKNKKMIVLSILCPILYWVGFCLLGYYDNRETEQIIKENPTNWFEKVW